MVEKEKMTNGGEVLSAKEAELIKELVKTRMETNRKLEYESFDGYEVPPRTQFSMLKKPTITIKYGQFTCNMAAVRLFEGVKFIVPMVNGRKKRFAVVPCAEEESGSVEWARQRQKDDAWVNKDVTSVDFTENIFNLMGWNRECRYKVHGRIKDSERGLILVFDLEEAIMFEPNKEDYVDPVTGETKKRQVKYYPDFYKNKIGRSYNDYAAASQMSKFESTESYVGADSLVAQTNVEKDQTSEQSVDTSDQEVAVFDAKKQEMEAPITMGDMSSYKSWVLINNQEQLLGGKMEYGEHSKIET